MRRIHVLAKELNYDISIHSSQAGWDAGSPLQVELLEEFQSTHPKRDETLQSIKFMIKKRISIHSSQAGWDKEDYQKFLHEIMISIHSSQAGWDFNPDFGKTFPMHFNPLIPSGMRLFIDSYRSQIIHFNPLIPSGMRLETKLKNGCLYCISIHSSQAGWDLWAMPIAVKSFFISIHSSQAGWDFSCIVASI